MTQTFIKGQTVVDRRDDEWHSGVFTKISKHRIESKRDFLILFTNTRQAKFTLLYFRQSTCFIIVLLKTVTRCHHVFQYAVMRV